MDFKMLLLKLGIVVIFFLQTALPAKDIMEYSPYTFTWEDAEARCVRQGHVLVPGRRYRAKLIQKWMIKENLESVWLNGWRSVSDTTPDANGKLRTLKIDFSRAQSKGIRMVCQIDSSFYDPTYKAESTETARSMCGKDKAVLADIRTQEDVEAASNTLLIDQPTWINSISSQGKSGYFISSKIKQCLVAQRVGDDLKYNYDDCSKEYSFICVKDAELIATFSPLISLKLARYEEFEEEIEKHKPTMTTSEYFEPFSSEIFLDVSSTETMIQATPSEEFFSTSIALPSTTTTEEPQKTSSEKQYTTPSEAQHTTPSEESVEITPTVKSSDISIKNETVETSTTDMPVITSTEGESETTTTELSSDGKMTDVSTTETPSEEITSATRVDITKKDIDIEITTSETPPGVTSTVITNTITEVRTPHISEEETQSVRLTPVIPVVLETSLLETTDSSETSSSAESSKASTIVDALTLQIFSSKPPSETSTDKTKESSPLVQSDTLVRSFSTTDSSSTTKTVTDISVTDSRYLSSEAVYDSEPKPEPEIRTTLESDTFYQISPTETVVSIESVYVSSDEDKSDNEEAKSSVTVDASDFVTEEEGFLATPSLEPSQHVYFPSTSSRDKTTEYSITDEIFPDFETEKPKDMDQESSVNAAPAGSTLVRTTQYAIESEPVITSKSIVLEKTQHSTEIPLVIIATPIIPVQLMSTFSDKTSDPTEEMASLMYKNDDIPFSVLPDRLDSSTETDGESASESSTSFYGCTVIDSTSFCPDTSVTTELETSDVDVITTGESSTSFYDCTVIDSTSFCPDTSVTTELKTSDVDVITTSESSTSFYDSTLEDSTSFYPDTSSATTKLDSSSDMDMDVLTSSRSIELLLESTTPPYETMPTASEIKSPTFSSPSDVSSVSLAVFDIDKGSESPKFDTPRPEPSTTDHYIDYSYYDSKEDDYKDQKPVDTVEDDDYDQLPYDSDEHSESPKYYTPRPEPSTTENIIPSTQLYDYKDYSYYDSKEDDDKDQKPVDTVEDDDYDQLPYDLDEDDDKKSYDLDEKKDTDDMTKVDEEIPGQIDIDEYDEENEPANVVGKKTKEEDGGIEVGLWVAFGILIALVVIALLLALYLYRRRKAQKSKDISPANGAAAAGAGTSAGETVELRDSRSPSRENGKPRESTTFKDPAYDI